MKLSTVARMGLLSFLIGCLSSGTYRKKGGDWYWKSEIMRRVPPGAALTELNGQFAKAGNVAFYRSSLLGDVDGATFVALNDHYARDKDHAWYCDDYRDGKEYFSIKHNRMVEIPGADGASFRLIDDYYARDTANLYFNGERFVVADLASFEVLGYLHGRDRVHGYYIRLPIDGSDGKTFVRVDDHYSKDKESVFYSGLIMADKTTEGGIKNIRLPGAEPASFVALESDYAADAGQVYYQQRVLPAAKPPLQVLAFGYAKTGAQVYYMGAPVTGADVASFATLATPTDDANATDVHGSYLGGKRVKK